MAKPIVLDAVIPAGGTIAPDYADRIGTQIRALAPLGPGQIPALQRVVDALRDSGSVRRIIAVAPPAVPAQILGVDEWLPSGDSGPANILNGLQRLPDADLPALVCTSDLPLLTGSAVREFVERCRADADLSLGLVGQPAYETAFPGSPMSVFAPLRDIGPVTMSCLFRVRPSLLRRNHALLQRAFAARKDQWRMAALLGPRLLMQFARRRLTCAAVRQRAETLLRCRAEALLDCPPVLAFDIDTADDYAYADQRLFETAAADTPAAHAPAADRRPMV